MTSVALRLARSGGPEAQTLTRSAASAAVAGALLVGALTGMWPALGIAAVAGALLIVIAVRDLALAVALWVPVLFIEALPAANAAGKAGGVLLLGTWIVQQRRSGGLQALLAGQRVLCCVLLALLAWATASVLWAPDWHHSLLALLRIYAVVALFLVFATTLRDARSLRRLLIAFVAGGVLSVVVSVVERGTLATTGQDRLAGAAGDPNFLGAWLLASVLLALGLLAGRRSHGARAACAATTAVLAGGLASTLSRGAFLAAATTSVLALLALRGRRTAVLAVMVLCTGGFATWLSMSEAAWQRLSQADGGSGRQDLWTIAWQMAVSNPLRGVGLDSFTVVADLYMRQVGPIPAPHLIVRTYPDEVHNVYLQTLAEGGPLALALLLGFVLLCLRVTLLAARRLDDVGETAMSSLAYSVLLAQTALLAAAVFLSSVVDKRLWLLLALGPPLAVLARAPAPAPVAR
jgi:O-antigen ligase